MKFLIMVFVATGFAGCSIFEPTPSRIDSEEDASSSDMKSSDLGSADADDIAMIDPDLGVDLTSSDAGRDIGDQGEVCATCGPDELCVDDRCQRRNGQTCAMDNQCLGVCDSDVCAPRRAMWVWDATVVADPIATATLFAFAAQKNVRTLYLESEALIYDADPGAGLTQANLSQFIFDADYNGIEVYLLFGFAEWARPANHAEITQLISLADQFARTAYGQPTGFVVDIEPHALPEWGTDTENLAIGFVDVLEKVMDARDPSGLPLYATIPFWYDTIDITRNGLERPLHQWVIDTVSGINVMNYRDLEATPNGLAELGSDELAYAASVERPVVMNVETQCGLLDITTFCEEGEAAMEAELSTWIQNEALNPSFRGIGIHDYPAYSSLIP